MNNISIYYKAREGQNSMLYKKEESVDLKKYVDVATLHVNLWKVKTGKWYLKTKYYVDFGLLVSAKVEYLNLYLPFDIEDFRSDYTRFDLGKKLNDKDLLSTVFNSDTKVLPCTNNSYCDVTLDDNRKYYLFSLGARNVEMESVHEAHFNGTKLKIKFNGGAPDDKSIEDLPEDSFVYVRFRVEPKTPDSLVLSEHVSNDMIQAAFSHMDMMDFRINEIREVDTKIIEEMKALGCKSLNFEEVHFFYATDFKEDVENGSSLKLDSRLMEKKQWENYMPISQMDNILYVAHHWKKKWDPTKKSIIKSFTIFFTTKYPKIEKLRLLVYICFAILIGWIASMLTFPMGNILHITTDCDVQIKCFVIVCIVVFLGVYLFFTHYRIMGIKIWRKR